MFFIGTTSVYLFVAISFERFKILKRPLEKHYLSEEKIRLIITVCVLLGFFWSISPLLGWSDYSLEVIDLIYSSLFKLKLKNDYN